MLQFITHANDSKNHLEIAEMALKGGCRWIQLRMKDVDEHIIEHTALQVKCLCNQYNAILIIDDYIELAIRIGASGVHLGKSDMPITEARALAPDGFIIGGTANTLEDMMSLAKDGVDYIGLGPFKFTQTKKKLSPVIGLEGYKQRMSQFKDLGYRTPVVAIGGIDMQDIHALMDTQISGIALSGLILNAKDPVEQTQLILQLLHSIPQR